MAKVESFQCDVCKKTTDVFHLSDDRGIQFNGTPIFPDGVKDVCRVCFEHALAKGNPHKPVYREYQDRPIVREYRPIVREDPAPDVDDAGPGESGWKGPSGPLPPPELP